MPGPRAAAWSRRLSRGLCLLPQGARKVRLDGDLRAVLLEAPGRCVPYAVIEGKVVYKHARFMCKKGNRSPITFIRTKGEVMGISHVVSQITRECSLLFILASRPHFPLSFLIG